MFHVPNKLRITYGLMGSGDHYGNNGAFQIDFSNRSSAMCIASDGEGWEHNNHPHVLHLWRPTNQVVPLPDSILVGFKGVSLKGIRKV